ncbi:LacI family transcriptional regulator [Rhizobium sp. AC44/96]|uniref:LacI family DNA-binding transcriptional regulator n=1 Tax=unclassified Rhizobium TaxID=2613769 RepID=UPI00080FB7A8|nr:MULTISPECIES: LacI family DNA-binding transcriptional regulator [unclassified Rhizobium]MDM9620432.1 LacI family DNA-binding transcriptional regulator [Rhizobium sp. S96]OCJ09081.1 LacI family transcriptional regulator [Rhizobium sp. AC44/96]
MEDFSEFVGLSRPTVSKYFSDPASVRRKTRDIIEAALKQSGFRPNLFAVNLNRRRSNIIGIIIPNSTDPFYMALTRRVELIANAAGFLAFVLSSDGNAEMEARAIETLKSMNVAGAIIAPLGVQSQHKTLLSLSASIPLIFVDSPLDDVSPFVGTNNRQSFQLIVDYLCRSGEPPCYLGMPPVNTNAVTRASAYGEAMSQLRMEPIVLPIGKPTDWDFEKFGYEETTRILQGGGFPTSTVLCANDRIAFGAISAAYHAGIKVGRAAGSQLRIAGHDDHPLSRYACPPITTVAQSYNEIGRIAMQLLLRKLGEEDDETSGSALDEQVLLNAEIILRESA